MTLLHNFIRNDAGADILEYAFIAGLFAAVCATVMVSARDSRIVFFN